jgi:hypothetical protein
MLIRTLGNDGFLPNQQLLENIIGEALDQVAPYSPICPVCVGKTWSTEFHGLRSLLAQSMVPLEVAIEFYGRLAPRRQQLGLSFWQFDERMVSGFCDPASK